MPFEPLFTVSQVAGELSLMRITNSSTGSDAAIVTIRVFVRLADGTYLVPAGTTTDYFVYPLGDATYDVDILSADYAPQIIILLLDADGDTLYTFSTTASFTGYSEQFYYTLTQGQAVDPNQLMDTEYYLNKMKLRVLIDSANQAISFAGDTAAAQNCLNRATYMIENESLFF
jgi:hypothetical protein